MDCIKRKNDTRNSIKVILHQNMHPNNQLCNRKGGDLYTWFSVLLCRLQTKNSTRSISDISPVTTENIGNKHKATFLWLRWLLIIANTATGKPHHTIANKYIMLSVRRTGKSMMRV